MSYLIAHILPELLEGLTVVLVGLAFILYRRHCYRKGVKKWMAMADHMNAVKQNCLGYADANILKKNGITVSKLDLQAFNGWVYINKRRPHPHDVNKHGGLK